MNESMQSVIHHAMRWLHLAYTIHRYFL